MSAVELAARGWHVFPLKPGEKTPATPDHAVNKCTGRDPRCKDGHTGWEPRATTDPDRIRRGWATAPYNVGVACGPSRLVVIDLDMPKPDKPLPEEWRALPGIGDGKDVFAQICEWAGMDFPLGETYTVATPSGGWHLYYTVPEGSTFRNTSSGIGPMVDTRASGGYVVGAGSVTPAGTYEVLHDEPVIELPRWIARLLTPPEREKPSGGEGFNASGPGRIAALVRTVETAPNGKRNDTLFWAACTMAGFAPEHLDQLAAAAARAGLDDREISGTIASAQRRAAA